MGDFGSLIFYIIIATVSAQCISKSLSSKRGAQVYAYAALGLSLPILMAAFRYFVGTDFGAYLRRYFNALYAPWGWANEFLSFAVEKITSFFQMPEIYFGAMSAVCIVPFYFANRFYRSHSVYGVTICVFLYILGVFIPGFNIIRQMSAVGVTVFASRYIFERRPLHYACWICVAAMFHNSAIVMLPVYFALVEDGKQNIKSVLLIVSVVLAVSNLPVIASIDTDLEYLSYVVERDTANRSFYLILFEFLFLYSNRKRIYRQSAFGKTFMLFMFIAVLLEMSGFINPIIKRIGFYFGVYKYFLFCYYIQSFRLSERNSPQILVILYFIARFSIVSVLMHQGQVIPYDTKSTYEGIYENMY